MEAGQPTSYFNVLREKGFNTRRKNVDETAPLYFINGKRNYLPIEILVSDNDMTNRFEQTQLLVSTLKHFGADENKINLQIIKNSCHCEHLSKTDENGNSVFAKMIFDFIRWCK